MILQIFMTDFMKHIIHHFLILVDESGLDLHNVGIELQ